jgi:hypothetical protein
MMPYPNQPAAEAEPPVPVAATPAPSDGLAPGEEGHPGFAAAHAEAASIPPVAGTSNESPQLPPSAQAAAARAHVLYGHIIAMAQQAQKDLERFIPAGMLTAAESEIGTMIRNII